MKFTKVLVSVLLVAVMAASMIACSSNDDSSATTAAPSATTANPTVTTTANNTTTAATTTAPVTTVSPEAKPTWPKEVPDSEVWGGAWSEVSEGRYMCDDADPDFAIIPVGQFEDGKTTYTVSVSYVWDTLRGCGVMFAAKDVDGTGKIEDDLDMYHLVLANGSVAHAYRSEIGWAGVWDTLDISNLGIEKDDTVKLTVVIHTDTSIVEAYLNDQTVGEWTVDMTGYGTWIGICTKNILAEYWDIEYAAE